MPLQGSKARWKLHQNDAPDVVALRFGKVAQWERGAKHPSGPALRLPEMFDPEKRIAQSFKCGEALRG